MKVASALKKLEGNPPSHPPLYYDAPVSDKKEVEIQAIMLLKIQLPSTALKRIVFYFCSFL
jgi:hypothetical protein